jgi:DNA-binding NarL/FixJ family response regulator
MTTIVLADEHHIVRQGLRVLLEAEPDFCVVGEATDGHAAIQLVERLQPEVLILDLMAPELKGLEVIRQVSQRSPQTRMVILSIVANQIHVLEALRNGAASYVLKKSTAAELFRAVREVTNGRRYLGFSLSEADIETYLKEASKTDSYDLLTARQREILHLIAQGCTSTQIAARLAISPRTVEAHRANLMRKLGLYTQTDLIRYLLLRGILPLEDKA